MSQRMGFRSCIVHAHYQLVELQDGCPFGLGDGTDWGFRLGGSAGLITLWRSAGTCVHSLGTHVRSSGHHASMSNAQHHRPSPALINQG